MAGLFGTHTGKMSDRRPAPSRDPVAGGDSWQRLSAGRDSPGQPGGEAGQADKLLGGLRRQRGWRRAAARSAAVLFVLAALALLIIAAVSI